MAKKMESELKEKVAEACRILAASGICSGVRAAVGHASARIPGTDRIVIKGRGYRNDALESMRPEDQLVVDLDCNIVSGPKGIAPAAEIKLYTHVYKTRPDVGGIVHAHPRFATVMSVVNIPMSVVCHEARTSPCRSSRLRRHESHFDGRNRFRDGGAWAGDPRCCSKLTARSRLERPNRRPST
jgi:ribulose-5-phosphate 4-epimerase/fuculose-1-phosphate aldolase